ncbi:MAG TPA: hypothetical protein VJH95_00430 [Candidatus Nanoarchaeia archaeon]|nr:hypothetical protein [Candidatus Nanoarchaeia archaeon]
MAQNRNKLIELFIGNLSNAVLHSMLEKAISNNELAGRYRQELITSLSIAKKYREKINPLHEPLPSKDKEYIKDKVIKKVKAGLAVRKAKGCKQPSQQAVGHYP